MSAGSRRHGAASLRKPAAEAWSADDRELMRADKVLRAGDGGAGPDRPRDRPARKPARSLRGTGEGDRRPAALDQGGRLDLGQAARPLRRQDAYARSSSCGGGGRRCARPASPTPRSSSSGPRRAGQGRPARSGAPQGSLRRGRLAELVEVKGIGRWSAEMFLIFHLGRQDVVSRATSGSAGRSRSRMGWTSCRGPRRSSGSQSRGGPTGRSPVSTLAVPGQHAGVADSLRRYAAALGMTDGILDTKWEAGMKLSAFCSWSERWPPALIATGCGSRRQRRQRHHREALTQGRMDPPG